MRFTFHVPGKPVPQGSMRSLGPRVMVHSNQSALLPWRATITAYAMAVRPKGWDHTGPMAVDMVFMLPRPKGHYNKAGRRKDSAPWWPATRVGDLDKLARAVNDALTDAGIWGDDAQVVHLTAQKQYADTAGLVCAVERLTEKG